MDKYLKKFEATSDDHNIIKEELIISDEENDDSVRMKTEPIDESFMDTDAEKNKSSGQIKRKSGSLENEIVNACNDKQSTLDFSLKSENAESNELPTNSNNVAIDEKPKDTAKAVYESDNIDTLYQRFTKSYCRKCKIKRAVIRRKARCRECNTPMAYSCESCNKTFRDFTNLGYHLQKHHTVNRQTHPCPVCNKIFDCRRSMLDHHRIQHGKSLTGRQRSSKRGRMFASKHVREHEKVCDAKAPFKCDKCPFATTYQTNLRNHVLNKHTDFDKECEKCGKIFTNRKSMKRHLQVYCNKTKRIECHHCGYKVYRKDQMLIHLDRTHFRGSLANNTTNDLQMSRICKYCDKTLDPHEKMKYHLRRCESAPLASRLENETADQPDLDTACKNLSMAYCENCKTKRPPKKGQRRCKQCEASLTFICERCPKSFNYAFRLLNHLRLKHVENTTFHRCDKCHNSYIHLKDLKFHEKTHHPPEPTTKMYKCSKCGKKYKNLGSLQKHRISCGKEPTFHCDKCPYKSHFKSNLKNHFKAKRATCI